MMVLLQQTSMLLLLGPNDLTGPLLTNNVHPSPSSGAR